jgi:nicotinic acid mononucleotide adenylyltransferase
VLQEAEILLYPRQGYILKDLPERVHALESPEVPYASRDFREMVVNLPDQALSFLPPLVAHYIRRHKLYGLKRKPNPK